MPTQSPDIFQKIACELNDLAGGSDCKALIYSEVEAGVISADVFVQPALATTVIFRFAPRELSDLIYSFWESGYGTVEPKAWATMQLVLSEGKFSFDFQFPDQLAQDEDLSDRRPRVLAAVFPGAKVDYSSAMSR